MSGPCRRPGRPFRDRRCTILLFLMSFDPHRTAACIKPGCNGPPVCGYLHKVYHPTPSAIIRCHDPLHEDFSHRKNGEILLWNRPGIKYGRRQSGHFFAAMRIRKRRLYRKLTTVIWINQGHHNDGANTILFPCLFYTFYDAFNLLN